jgi:hypothetical protein
VPVARVGHLIALKLRPRDGRRIRDQLDLQALPAVATEADLENARKGVALIVGPGIRRGLRRTRVGIQVGGPRCLATRAAPG